MDLLLGVLEVGPVLLVLLPAVYRALPQPAFFRFAVIYPVTSYLSGHAAYLCLTRLFSPWLALAAFVAGSVPVVFLLGWNRRFQVLDHPASGLLLGLVLHGMGTLFFLHHDMRTLVS